MNIAYKKKYCVFLLSILLLVSIDILSYNHIALGSSDCNGDDDDNDDKNNNNNNNDNGGEDEEKGKRVMITMMMFHLYFHNDFLRVVFL